MKIIKRLSDSIISPSQLSNAVNDKGRTTFLYVLVLVLIMIIPYIVNSFSILDLNYDTKVEIRNLLFKEEINFKIEDGVMVNYGEEDYYYNKDFMSSFGLYISDDSEVVLEDDNGAVVLALLSDGVYFSTGVFSQKVISYSEYGELQNLDFAGVKDDKLSFWDPVFSVVQRKLNEVKPFYIVIYILSSIFQSIVTICFYALILAWFNRFGIRTHLKFSDHWKLCLYGLTGFVIGNTLAILFNFVLLYYAGFILSIVICTISSRKFIIRGGSNEL